MADGKNGQSALAVEARSSQASPIGHQPCPLQSNQTMTQTEDWISPRVRLSGIPRGYRVASLIMNKLAAVSEESNSPSAFGDFLSGHEFYGQALCLDETQYDQELHQAIQVAALLAQGRQSGGTSPQEYLRLNHPAWRLFPVEIEVLIDPGTRTLLKLGAA